jgi:hypothetical protein
MPKRTPFFVSWLLGFFLVFNLYLIPSIAQTPRITDVLGAVLGLWLLWRFATKGVYGNLLIALSAIGAIPFLWGLYAFSTDDLLTVVRSSRWLLAVPWAYALFTTVRSPLLRMSLLWGIWWGCVGIAAVMALQYYDFLELTQNIGLAPQDADPSSVAGTPRATGMEGHPNAGTAVVSLIVPVSLYFYYARAARAWVVVVGLSVVLVSTQFTLTRGALTSALATTMIVIAARPSRIRSIRLVALLTLLLLPTLYALGPPGGRERWLDPESLQRNLEERLLTMKDAAQVSLEHPLGLGDVAAGQALLQSGANPVVVHAAFLQLAVLYGLLFAGAIVLLMLPLALQLLKGPKTTWLLEAVLVVHLFGLFFFEDQLNVPTFVILTYWLVVASAVQITTSSFALENRELA